MYENAIVTFIDILGFRTLVGQSSAEDVSRKLQAVTRSATPNPDLGDSFGPQTYQFSDSVVRVTPIESGINAEYQTGILFHELLELVWAQAELVHSGVLLRGGIAIGQVAMTDRNIFGPGLIAAYELESNFANYPRIVVDPRLMNEAKVNELLKATHHSQAQVLEYISQLTRRGDDGIWFVDYCAAVISEYDDPEGYLEFLARHKSLILENAQMHVGLNSVLSKYLWLATYHNYCVRQLDKELCAEHGLDIHSLLITANEIPAFIESAL